jgi:hypothetical protein
VSVDPDPTNDGVAVGGAVDLVDGVASLDLGRLSSGPHTIGASYSGDQYYSGSTGTLAVVATAVPTAVDDAVQTHEDVSSVEIDVLANDGDADGDPILIVESGGAAHGSVTCTAARCTYTPDPDFNGADSFTYTIDDGGLTATGTVNVTVVPINDLPVVTPVTVDTVSGWPVTFNLLDFATEPDGDAMTVSGHTQPAHGTLNCTDDGACTYTPDADYVGADAFEFFVSHGTDIPTEAAAELVVTAPDDPDNPDGATTTTTAPLGADGKGGQDRPSSRAPSASSPLAFTGSDLARNAATGVALVGLGLLLRLMAVRRRRATRVS